jgi:hypothetical protein
MRHSPNRQSAAARSAEPAPPAPSEGQTVAIPLTSYRNIVKFLRRAYEHRPNRDVLWCLRALDDYAPRNE